MSEGLVKALLDNIFGILPVPCYPLCHGECSTFVAGNQLLESLHISALCGSHQRAVRFLVCARCTRRCHDQNLLAVWSAANLEQSNEDAKSRRRRKRSEVIVRERDAPMQE